MGKNRNATRLGNPANDLWKLRPKRLYITSLTVAQISLECLGSIANHASLCKNLSKVRAPRNIAAGSLGGLTEKIINTKFTQPLSDHSCTSPAIVILPLQSLPETVCLRIKIEADDMDGAAFPEAGELNPRNQHDALCLRSRLRFGKSRDSVMVGQGKVGNAATGRTLNQRRR